VGGREGASTSKTRLDGVDTRTLLTHYCPLRQVTIATLTVKDMRDTVVLDSIKHLHLQRKKIPNFDFIVSQYLKHSHYLDRFGV
jgi:hypothetical protein